MDIPGFGRLGLHDRPDRRPSSFDSRNDGANGRGMKDFAVPGPHGVAHAMNAPTRPLNRGSGKALRDIVAPAQVPNLFFC